MKNDTRNDPRRAAALSLAYESIAEKAKATGPVQLPLGLGAYFFQKIIGTHTVRAAIVNGRTVLCLRDLCGLMGYSASGASHTVRSIFEHRKIPLKAYVTLLQMPHRPGRKLAYISIPGLRVLCGLVKPDRTASIREWIVAQSLGAGNRPETPESLAPLPKTAGLTAVSAKLIADTHEPVQPWRDYAGQLAALLAACCTGAEVLELVRQLEAVKAAVLAARYAPVLNQAAYDLFCNIVKGKTA